VLGNTLVRIILRTGQPGQAPEKQVILEYDINDYKTKTELTSQKLFTTLVSSLRSYSDLYTIAENKRGLERIIDASSSIFEIQSMESFIDGVLTQLVSLLHLHKDAIYVNADCDTKLCDCNNVHLVATMGKFEALDDGNMREKIDPQVAQDLEAARLAQNSVYYEDRMVIYFKATNGTQNMIYLENQNPISVWDKNLLEIFCHNVALAFDNIHLRQDVEKTQKEVIGRIGSIAETRSKETGNHVKRVAEYSKLFALKLGLSQDEADTIKEASPMHDIGKVGIPDTILNKPEKLTFDEFEIMKQHAEIGYEMLKDSTRPLIQTAAKIARDHHEKWDGSGYPRGLRGADIHIYGRITAIADVFDALASDRCYKDAWPLEKVYDLFRLESGAHFDPNLVEIFFEHQEEFLTIKEYCKDEL
jgi:response regulator RpfG family c-di-GMP phosphodiesterase